MKKFFLIIFVSASLFADNWEDLIKKYKNVMGENSYNIIYKQYQDFTSGKSPKIADEVIKSINIVECGQDLVDLKTANHARIETLEGQELYQAHEKPEDIDPRAEKYSMMRKSVFECLMNMVKELDNLAPEFGYNSGELEIRLFEGLRDLSTQKKLFDTKLSELKIKRPELTEEELYQETSKWVSPYTNNVPTHSTGGAIDICLYNNKTKTFCDMGGFNVGGQIALTFSNNSDLTDTQKNNRLLFLIAATRAGLTNYAYEFWHFSYGDRYASYYRENSPEKRCAIYNSVK